jgi:hypothetical protein
MEIFPLGRFVVTYTELPLQAPPGPSLLSILLVNKLSRLNTPSLARSSYLRVIY